MFTGGTHEDLMMSHGYWTRYRTHYRKTGHYFNLAHQHTPIGEYLTPEGMMTSHGHLTRIRRGALVKILRRNRIHHYPNASPLR